MLTLAVAALTTGALAIHYDQFSGLSVTVSGATLVVGSSFQYYEPGGRGGIFSSRWHPKSVTKTESAVVVRFQARGASGILTYTLDGNDLTAKYDFAWNGDREVRIENCFGLLWASAFKDATAASPGIRRSRFADVPFSDQDVMQRAIAVNTPEITFRAPFGDLALASDVPFLVYDGRNLNQDWARGRPVHWAGVAGHRIKPGGRVSYTARWSFSHLLDRPASTETVAGLAAKMEGAQAPQEPLPLVPSPRELKMGSGSIPTTGRFVGAVSPSSASTKCIEILNRTVAQRWVTTDGPPTPVEIVLSDVGGPSYSVFIRDGRVHIRASSEAGLVAGAVRLAQMVRSDGERLVIPEFSIGADYPKVEWRGVHMFVGPEALPFQTKLMDMLLVPLGYTHAVLQCERTAWDSLPGTQTSLTMKKADLARLFETYRDRGIQPIPLIQSLGHMEWFFANGKNAELAVNPAQPYTLDSRRAEAREAIAKVWEEAIALLRPRAVHFGLDEIDSRGINDPNLATRLWKAQVPFLSEIAKNHAVVPMVWADMMLAAEESGGTAHAPNRQAAAERREALSNGTRVVDWQYFANSDPGAYKSLKLWNDLGHKPIAAGWNSAENIFGLARAAEQHQAGYLQTTWAGYESNELNIAKDLSVPAGYVLAAEYTWGHQPLPPGRLPYDPKETARRMLFDRPQPAEPLDGLSMLANTGPESSIGQYRFRGQNLFELRSNVSSSSAAKPTGVVLTVNRPATRLAVSLDCFAWMEYGAAVAQVTVRFADGSTAVKPLVYGFDLRASDDPNPTATPRKDGKSAVVIEFEPSLVKTIEFHRSDSAAGLRVHGITLI